MRLPENGPSNRINFRNAIMKREATIIVNPSWLLSPDDYRWFKQRFPDGAGSTFVKRFNLDSEDWRECRDHLHDIGLKRAPQSIMFNPGKQQEHLKGYYSMRAWRSFTAKDCEKSELLHFFLDRDMQEACLVDETGEPFVEMSHLENEAPSHLQSAFRNGRLPFVDLSYNRLAVSDEGRQLLDASGLIGFSITRRLGVKGHGADKFKGIYWLVDFPIVLPPLSLQTLWESFEGEEYAGAWRKGAELSNDGFYTYDRAALQASGPFDLALMRRLDPESRDYQRFERIGSRRWFDFCKANKIRCQWQPVKVVD